MDSKQFSDDEIRDIAMAGYVAIGYPDFVLTDASLRHARYAIDGETVNLNPDWRDAARSRAAAILAARKRESPAPAKRWTYGGKPLPDGRWIYHCGDCGAEFGEDMLIKYVGSRHPCAVQPVPPLAPSALSRLLCADILRHQPIALQRAIVDTMQAGREVPSRLLWRMELSREPEADALRREVIAGRIRARGWKAARE